LDGLNNGKKNSKILKKNTQRAHYLERKEKKKLSWVEKTEGGVEESFVLCKSTHGHLHALCCADCEVGPLGVHHLNETPERYLVAANRVRYRV